ncbi:hypothetical protein D3C86_1442630 [compost metagenome]
MQNLRYRSEHRIPDFMTETVVYLFKVIDIDKHQSRFPTGLLEFFEFMLNAFFEQAAIGDIQQRVHHCNTFQLARFNAQAQRNTVRQHAEGDDIDSN